VRNGAVTGLVATNPPCVLHGKTRSHQSSTRCVDMHPSANTAASAGSFGKLFGRGAWGRIFPTLPVGLAGLASLSCYVPVCLRRRMAASCAPWRADRRGRPVLTRGNGPKTGVRPVPRTRGPGRRGLRRLFPAVQGGEAVAVIYVYRRDVQVTYVSIQSKI
jgi:hypothetical protein